MSTSLDFPPSSELLCLPRLDPDTIKPEAAAKHYIAYEKALTAVYKGSSVRDAAKHYSVRRGTLNDIVAESLRLHGDGKLVGYRACQWHHRREPAPNAAAPALSSEPPASLAAVLQRLPAALALVVAFRGRLPDRQRASRAFDAFFKRFMKLVTGAGWAESPLWASPDRGRRALIRRLRRARETLPAADLDEEPPEKGHATRLEHLFSLKPFDRFEIDGHRIDVKWRALVQTPDGGWVPRLITCLWLIAIIDVVSRAIVAWNVVVKDNYNRFDLLRTVSRSLVPWRRRVLICPGMVYHPEAWMPNAVDTASAIMRAASLAMDSAMAHIARDATNNLADFFRGVVNLGFPGVPESRAHIEAFFKKVEAQVLRLIAGGFRPAGADDDGPTDTTGLRPEDYPVKLQALDDLMDVAVSGYNPTEQDELFNRSPRQVVEQYFESAVPIRSTLTADDLAQLLVLRFRVKITGKKKVRQPFVKWKGGRYRTDKMRDRWHLLGERFDATVNADDPRRMALWRDGKLYAVLHVLPPWAASPHDLETRLRALACKKRGLVSWKGKDDAVAAYLEAVRQWALELGWATDEYLRSDLAAAPRRAASAAPASPGSALFDLTPRRPRR